MDLRCTMVSGPNSWYAFRNNHSWTRNKLEFSCRRSGGMRPRVFTCSPGVVTSLSGLGLDAGTWHTQRTTSPANPKQRRTIQKGFSNPKERLRTRPTNSKYSTDEGPDDRWKTCRVRMRSAHPTKPLPRAYTIKHLLSGLSGLIRKQLKATINKHLPRAIIATNFHPEKSSTAWNSSCSFGSTSWTNDRGLDGL